MIVVHKKMMAYAGGCLLLFLSILFCLLGFADDKTAWFSNLFFDKLVVFLLTPPFLLGTLLIERTITPTVIVRTKNRTHALLLELMPPNFIRENRISRINQTVK